MTQQAAVAITAAAARLVPVGAGTLPAYPWQFDEAATVPAAVVEAGNLSSVGVSMKGRSGYRMTVLVKVAAVSTAQARQLAQQVWASVLNNRAPDGGYAMRDVDAETVRFIDPQSGDAYDGLPPQVYLEFECAVVPVAP